MWIIIIITICVIFTASWSIFVLATIITVIPCVSAITIIIIVFALIDRRIRFSHWVFTIKDAGAGTRIVSLGVVSVGLFLFLFRSVGSFV